MTGRPTHLGMVATTSPAGWHADPADPRVRRYWDGSVWRAQRVWNGAQWVHTALGAPPPVVTQSAVPTTRRHRGLWIGAGAVLAVVVVVIAVTAVAAGKSGSENHAASCRDLSSATTLFTRAAITQDTADGPLRPDPAGNLYNEYSAAQKAQLRAAISRAKSLESTAPSGLKSELGAIARGLSAALANRNDSNVNDDPTINNSGLTTWLIANCPAS